MDHPPHPPHGHRGLLAAIALVVVGYFALAAAGIPQQATEAKRQAATGGTGVSPVLSADTGETPVPPMPATTTGIEKVHFAPPYWTVLPFVFLLAGIAVLPLLPATAHWWESNLHRFYVSAALAAVTLGYYLFLRDTPLPAEWPAPHWTAPATAGPNFAQARDFLAGAILGEYGPFILLLSSLYVISGGIRMAGELPAYPRTNAALLAVGAVLASVIGTTGAAMLLIRPLLETNRHRRHVTHTVVFFIFVVCNCGGCLLPTGDPPLFIGYLLGVPFFWTLVLWREWLLVNFLLIALYYLLDRFWHYRREPAEALARDRARVHRLRFHGVWPGVLLLAGTVACLALLNPGRPLPGTTWHPWIYLREVVLLGLIAASLLLGSDEVRHGNQFRYGPMVEVGVLFLGHLSLHAAAAGDSPRAGAAAGAALAGAVLLDHGRTVGGSGQRPYLRRLFHDRPLAARRRGGRRGRGGAAACGDQPRRRFLWSDDVHRQRAELHGPRDRPARRRRHARLLRVHGL